MNKETISVCILAYNRAAFLPKLLDSILPQIDEDCEIVICEDSSPERLEIRKVVEHYQERYPGKIVYSENLKNLGYDGNFRRIIEVANGEYCLFMGNDDLLAPGAIEHLRHLLGKYPGLGAVLRSYQAIHYDTGKPEELFRYYDSERFFPPGAQAMAAFYRRFVVISGLVLRRRSALDVATDRFDGILLYQLYLVGRILAQKPGVATPFIMALYRQWGIPEHGSAAIEQGKFIPQQITPEGSLHFIGGMIEISKALERDTKEPVRALIWKDLCAYSYPFLSLHARLNPKRFVWYAHELGKLGFSRSPWFWLYYIGLRLLGDRRCDSLIRILKTILGHTPRLP